MATAYTSLLGLALPVTGELSGTWGDTVNNSITSLLDSAIAGTTTISSDADVTLTTTTGAANTARPAILLWTAGGTVTRNITAPAQSKAYIVINASSSTQSIVLRGAGPTTGVTIVQGEKAVCAWNGSDFVKVANISGAGVFTTVTASSAVTVTSQFNSASTFGFKNRIINGAMVIDQRNAGASVTPTATAYTLDRWQFLINQSSKFTTQQSSTAPTGFINSILVTSSSAYSVLTGDYFTVRQAIEGLNVADFAWGTANAVTVTLSFWVRSSLTGTFGGAINNNAGDRSYPFTYTINSANTFEQKTVTIAGDTSGTWLTTNSRGMMISFGLGVGTTFSGTAGAWAGANYLSATGATSVVGTNGATFYITGVQLEKGSTATSFDYRSYPTELGMCQRYYYRTTPGSVARPFGSGFTQATTEAIVITPYPVTLRTPPTALEQTGTAGDYSYGEAGTSFTCSAVPIFSVATIDTAMSKLTVASGLTVGRGGYGRAVNATAYLGWSAEL